MSRADLEIDLGSIDLASEEAETEVKRAGWFDTGKFPVAQFQSTAMNALGGDKYEVVGKLTLKGIVKELSIPVVLRTDPSGNSVVEGQFTLKRLEFRIGSGQWADPAVVSDDVLVRVRLVLARTG
jgi:polyisoprenoid-binding protein YceI